MHNGYAPPATRADAGAALPKLPWWMPILTAFAFWAGVIVALVNRDDTQAMAVGSLGWWLLTAVLHSPYLLILAFLAAGMLERIGFFWRGRAPVAPGRVPTTLPSVCVQLPMYNEHAVARRAIKAAAAMAWPADRLTIQVLDDSTDPAVVALVREMCERIEATTGVTCTLLHRTDRTGYKAGALEAGRRRTDAEFIAIFDADFVPPRDFLRRTIPHFYDAGGAPVDDLALVQAQWGHLNHDESFLTRAQALWVDDHHTLQMSWRSAAMRFVNFTGTAGVWRASAIEAAGGWRSASLVEDCELSFRALFAGYRTRFVKEIVVPAELPGTFAAYRLQQKRWTQGWAQLQRLHLATLLFHHRAPWPRKVLLAYHMCVSWQWPAWALWISTLPFLILTGYWLGALSTGIGFLVYAVPALVTAAIAALIATLETRHTYAASPHSPRIRRRLARLVPYFIVNAGMLPHQLSAFVEGLCGPLHGEFERTPKVAAVGRSRARTQRRRPRMSHAAPLHPPYIAIEAGYLIAQVAWIALFVADGLHVAALGAAWLVACVAGIGIASYAPRLLPQTRR